MPGMPFLSHGVTHVGHVRRRNEDAFLDRPQRGLWAVADGMGGHEEGDHASARIVATLDGLTPAASLDDAVRDAAAALAAVDRELRARAAGLGRYAVIASTVVVLLARGEGLAALWAGDSRLYCWRAGELRQVSTDHSRVQELVDAGLLRPQEAAGHPQSHIVTRAIGAGPVELGIVRDRLLPGDRLLLCSDGLTNMVADPDIAAGLAAGMPRHAAERLRDRALAQGGLDNITVVVVEAA